MHSEAAWQYPMHLVHWLHKNLDLHPKKSTTNIMVNKFKYLKLDDTKEEYITITDPNVILCTPILESFTSNHELDTHCYCFKVECHSCSPTLLGTSHSHLITP